MRKNGSRFISLKQYKLTDLFLFAVILAVFDLLAYFAPKLIPAGSMFVFTLTVPIVLLIMMRWGWISLFFCVGDGLLLSVLNNLNVWQSYVCYPIGNCFILLLLFATKYIGKEKIRSKWYFSALFAVLGWLLMNVGITVLEAICGYNFAKMLALNFGFGMNGLMSLAVAVLLILIFRKLEGMFEDQKSYILRLEQERKERAKRDTFGDEPIEIDEESIAALKKNDDELY